MHVCTTKYLFFCAVCLHLSGYRGLCAPAMFFKPRNPHTLPCVPLQSSVPNHCQRYGSCTYETSRGWLYRRRNSPGIDRLVHSSPPGPDSARKGHTFLYHKCVISSLSRGNTMQTDARPAFLNPPLSYQATGHRSVSAELSIPLAERPGRSGKIPRWHRKQPCLGKGAWHHLPHLVRHEAGDVRVQLKALSFRC